MKQEIDKLELAWQTLADQTGADPYEVTKLRRHLDWAYSEVGYAAPNRSAIANPRTLDESKSSVLSLDSIPPQRRDIAQKILDGFAAAGFGQVQQVAALANAIAESNLDPDIKSPVSSATGLFLVISSAAGGKTPEQLRDPETNIAAIIELAKRAPAFAAATTLDDAVSTFVRFVMRPANANAEIVRRQQIARRLLHA
jgi:hypothetical protein